MKKVLLLVFAFSVAFVNADAQRSCGTMQHHDQMIASNPEYAKAFAEVDRIIEQKMKDPNYRASGGTITIPVVFHILYSNSAQNISNARIQAQMNVLNNDYSSQNSDITSTPSVFTSVIPPAPQGTGIQFCLAQQDPSGNPTDGILRVPTTVTSFGMSGDPIKYDATGGDNAWPRDQYLNIWVGNLSGGLLGYAQFPSTSPTTAATDGVVLLYSSVGGPGTPGTIANYNLGRTATHEIGHWLNLRHIWGDQTCGNDFVADTPTQASANFSCPSFPKLSNNCAGNPPNGDMFMNYMDYVDDDCMVMFTAGQSARMNTCLSTIRPSILSSPGCTPVGLFENTQSLQGISLYPNPADDYVMIQNNGKPLSSATVNVINNVGQLVSTSTFDVLGSASRLDISNLAKGIYMIEVEAAGRKSVTRLVIDRK